MLKKVGIGLIIIVALVVIISFLLPSNSIVERSIVVDAPAKVVFKQVNNLRNWSNWSPWAKMDPDMEIEYFGPETGVNSKYCWEGDPETVGTGCLTIVENEENASISTLLQFEGMGEGNGSWTFEESEEGTKVTWAMNSDMSKPAIIGRYFGLMMDGMLGPTFEEGLESLKEIAETTPSYSIKITQEEMPAMNYIFVRDSCSEEEISQTFNDMAGQMGAFMGKNKLSMAGAPFAGYYSWEGTFDFYFAFPVAETPESGEGNVQVASKDAFKCVKGIFYGNWAETYKGHDEMMKYMEDNNLEMTGEPLEFYMTDPEQQPDTAKWETQIVYQL